MQLKHAKVIAVIAVVEFIIIVALARYTITTRLRVAVNKQYETVSPNPLQEALDYDASDQRFAELVRRFPGWVKHRPNSNSTFTSSILTDSAAMLKTNYVKILIQHGADVNEAINYHMQKSNNEAVDLLSQMREAAKGAKQD